jgi:WD40 repeat protein
MPNDTPELSGSDARFEQVLTEILQAEEQGQTPDLQAYLERFPDLEAPLREFFRNRAGFARLAPQLAATPAASESGPPSQADTISGPDGLSAPVLPPGSRFGGYEIVDVLGRGGMGIVYRARQLVPEREVALKVIRTDRLEELPDEERRQWLERFQREAQLVASLDQHAHIVGLFEVGEHDGQPYFTMRLLAGGSLAQRLEAADGPDPAAAADRRARDQQANAELVAKVARAVDYAHRRGILHRDLKPANILLDAEGEPLVSDFGLARRLDQTGSLVASGIVGTAPYMPPEQAMASPGAATTAADVYSLGAILYELLTGRPPFRGKSDLDTLLLVVQRAAVPPRQLNSRLSRDLEIICQKCLEKEPARRYQTAAALADDLDNWRAGRPIHARPVRTVGRLWRWGKRNPAMATVSSLAVVAVLAVLGVAISFGIYQTQAAENLRGALDQVQDQKKQADEKTELARKRLEVSQNLLLTMQLRRVAEVWKRSPAQGLEWLEDGNCCPAEVRDFTWGLFYGLCQPPRKLKHTAGVTSLAFSPDGKKLASGEEGGNVRLWDVAAGKERAASKGLTRRVYGLVFSVDGKTLAWVDELSRVWLWDPAVRKERALKGHTGMATCLALSPDGKTLAWGEFDRKTLAREELGGTVRLWDVAAGKERPGLKGRGVVRSLAFSPDGKTLASGEWGGTVRLWNLAARKERSALNGHTPMVLCLAFSPDSKTLAWVDNAGTVRLWDPAARTDRALKAPGRATCLAFSPDGKTLASGEMFGTVRLWNLVGGKESLTLKGDTHTVYCLTFSPDSKTLAWGDGGAAPRPPHPLHDPEGHSKTLASGDGGPHLTQSGGAVWLWDLAPRKENAAVKSPGAFSRLAFSPDSKTLTSVQSDGAVRLWEVATSTERAVLKGLGLDFCLGFGLDGKTVASADNGTVRLWDVATQTERAALKGHTSKATRLAISPDGKTLASGDITGAARGTVRLWDVAAGKERAALKGHPRGMSGTASPSAGKPKERAALNGNPRGVYYLAFSPDSKTLASADDGGTVRLWDVAAGKERAAIKGADTGRLVLSPGPPVFSPDGKTLAWKEGGGAVRLWDVAAGKEHPAPEWPTGAVICLAFSPDSKTLALAGWGPVWLWDVAAGKVRAALKGQTGFVYCLAFSPDGRTLASAGGGQLRGEGGAVWLWDVATGEERAVLKGHTREVTCLAFSPDGRTLASGDQGGTLRLWKAVFPKQEASLGTERLNK